MHQSPWYVIGELVLVLIVSYVGMLSYHFLHGFFKGLHRGNQE